MDLQSNWPSKRLLVISWRKILESLELPECQTGPVVTISLLHHPEPTDFPVNGGDCPACIFVSLKLICLCWRMGSRSSEQGRGHEGIKEVTMQSLRKEKGTFLPTEAVGLIGHMVEKDLCFSGLIGVNILD